MTVTSNDIIFMALLAIVTVTVLAILKFKKTDDYEITEEGNQLIGEFRNYMIQEWICLLAFWLEVAPEKLKTNMSYPDAETNCVHVYLHNLEFVGNFYWEEKKLEIISSVYKDQEGYIVKKKVFDFSGNNLHNSEMFNFICAAKIEHDGLNKLTPNQMLEITRDLKDVEGGFESEVQAEKYFFELMSELIILMRDKKNYTNRKLLDIYFSLVFYLWKTKGEKYIDYLKQINGENEDNN